MQKTVIVVVHGIGDPLPGDALGALVQGLIGTTPLHESAPRTVEQRVEPDDAATGSPFVNCYPAAGATMCDVLGRSTQGNNEIYLREVYWGDLSRVKNSVTGLLVALFDFIFGLKYIATAAHAAALARPASKGASRLFVRLADVCSKAAFWLVRGPLFALNLLAASIGLTTHYRGRLFDLSERDAAVVGSVVLVLIAFAIRERLRLRRWSMTTVNTMLVVGLIGAVGSWWCWPQAPGDKNPAIEAITAMISLVALLIAFAGLLMTALHLTAWLVHWKRRRGRLLSRSLVAANFCTALGVGLFAFVVMLAWAAVNKAVGGDERLEGALHLFGVIWVAFIAMIAAYLIVMYLNARRASSGLHQERLRYVVSPLVVGAFCLVMLMYAVLVIPMVLHLERHLLVPLTNGWPAPLWEGAAWVFGRIESFDNNMKPWALAASGLLIAILTYARAPLLIALDLVLDAVAHFKTAPKGLGSKGVGPTRFGAFDPAPKRWLWEAMVDRFQDVLASAVRDLEPDRVIIVSHSQGTTVALAGLGILEIVGARRRAASQVCTTSIDVVTLGSPVRHLYRYYMLALYRINRRLAPRVRWLNVFREDDFIGTRIGDIDHAWPTNMRIGPRSHTNYWRDREVLDKVLTWLNFPKA